MKHTDSNKSSMSSILAMEMCLCSRPVPNQYYAGHSQRTDLTSHCFLIERRKSHCGVQLVGNFLTDEFRSLTPPKKSVLSKVIENSISRMFRFISLT